MLSSGGQAGLWRDGKEKASFAAVAGMCCIGFAVGGLLESSPSE